MYIRGYALISDPAAYGNTSPAHTADKTAGKTLTPGFVSVRAHHGDGLAAVRVLGHGCAEGLLARGVGHEVVRGDPVPVRGHVGSAGSGLLEGRGQVGSLLPWWRFGGLSRGQVDGHGAAIHGDAMLAAVVAMVATLAVAGVVVLAVLAAVLVAALVVVLLMVVLVVWRRRREQREYRVVLVLVVEHGDVSSRGREWRRSRRLAVPQMVVMQQLRPARVAGDDAQGSANRGGLAGRGAILLAGRR